MSRDEFGMKCMLPLLSLSCLVLLATGCSSTVMDTLLPADQSASSFAEEQKHREHFQEHSDAASIRWLLSNRVKNGMSKSDIDAIVGQYGERIFDDKKYLTEQGPVPR